MYAKEMLRVIYAPQKAFKEIIQNPRYIGPFLIMLLFMVANVGFGYVQLSKRYLDQTAPNADEFGEWTEDVAFWSSNVSKTANTSDYISGIYYGNQSIEFSSSSSSQVWMQLNISDPLSCSGSEGYKDLSFRIKLIEPSTQPSNVSLYLFSTNLQDNFYHNITNEINQVGIWNNLTLSVGQGSEGWIKNGNAEWNNITGLKLEFTWSSDSNIILLIDGLFFHGVYKSLVEIDSGRLINFPISAFMQFTIQWVVLGAMLFVIPKIFKVKTVWKNMLIIAGFALVTLLIEIIVFIGIHLAWSDLRMPLKFLGGVSGEWQETYMQTFVPLFTVFWYIDKIVWVWIVVLCAIALRLMFSLSWAKSFLMAISSYALYIIILLFLVPGAVLL